MIRITEGKYKGLYGTYSEREGDVCICVKVPEGHTEKMGWYYPDVVTTKFVIDSFEGIDSP